MDQASRKKAQEYLLEFKQLGLFQADAGSVSISLDDGIWITKSGNVKYSDTGFVYVDKAGNVQDDLGGKLSGEYEIHRRILFPRPDSSAVIHTHSAFHAAFGNLFPDYDFNEPVLEIRKALGIRDPNANYVLHTVPNFFEKEMLSETVAQALSDNIAVLVQNHGMFVVGPSLDKARTYILALDSMMQQVYLESLIKSRG